MAGVALWAVTLAVLIWWGRWEERRPPRHRGPCNGLWFIVLNIKDPNLVIQCLRCGAREPATRFKVEAATRENEVSGVLDALRVTGGEDGER